jgi:hypothetical protein
MQGWNDMYWAGLTGNWFTNSHLQYYPCNYTSLPFQKTLHQNPDIRDSFILKIQGTITYNVVPWPCRKFMRVCEIFYKLTVSLRQTYKSCPIVMTRYRTQRNSARQIRSFSMVVQILVLTPEFLNSSHWGKWFKLQHGMLSGHEPFLSPVLGPYFCPLCTSGNVACIR